METVKLTDTRVRSIQPGKVIIRQWDSVVAGFYVRVNPGGTRSYAIQFQRPSGSKVQVTIGDAGVWTAEAAREQARKLREVHDAGKDARAHLQDKRNSKDVAALVKVWKADYRAKLKPSTQRSHDSIIGNVIMPALGARLVKDLDRSSIKDLYRREAKKHPTQANRTIEILSKLLSIAEEEGWRPLQSNPCFRFPKTRLTTCKRILTGPELGRLETAMLSLEKSGKVDQIATDLIRFLALSGLRAGEAGNLAWKDIDLDHGTMTFHDHKTSAKMGAKVLPLNPPLRAIIQRRAGLKLGKLVFPGLVHDRPIQGLRNMWLRILAVEGCELGEATPHDLRRGFMSVSVELGYPPAIGDTLLGHSLGKIRDTYMQMSMDGILRSASEDTAAWIASALRGENPKPGVKIVTTETAKQA